MVVEAIVGAAVVAVLVERRGNDGRGLRADRRCDGQLAESVRILGEAGGLTLALKGEEAEELVLLERPAHRSSELLAAVGGLVGAGLGGLRVKSVQRLVTEKAEQRAMIVVGAGLGDHIDGRAFGTAIGGREALRADHKFL